MRAKVVQLGNSRGVRIAKALLEQCGIGDSVDLDVTEGTITLRAVPRARSGWEEAARKMAERSEDQLIEDVVPTRFDETDWTW